MGYKKHHIIYNKFDSCNVELISAELWEPTLCIMWCGHQEVSLGAPHLHDQSYITLQH